MRTPCLATATTFLLIRAISIPLGFSDPKWPVIAATVCRTVADTQARRYFFEDACNPAIFRVELQKVLPAAGGKPMKLDLSERPILSGNIVAAEPFEFLVK